MRNINQAAIGSGFVDRPDAAGFTYQQQTRPFFQQFPNFGVIDQLESVGISSYNSLQATLRTRNWRGIISQFSYTLAHNLDEASNATSLPQDSNNLMGDYGNAASDIRHHFGGYALVDLPGRRMGAGMVVARLAAERECLDSDRLPLHRARVVGYQRYRRKHDARQSGRRSVRERLA